MWASKGRGLALLLTRLLGELTDDELEALHVAIERERSRRWKLSRSRAVPHD